MPRLLLFCLLLLSYSALAPSLGRACGRVTGPGGQGLEGVSVVDATGRFATLTDASGRFLLDKLPLGDYTLITRSLSHVEGRKTFALSAEQPIATVDFALATSTNAIQEVEVLGRQKPLIRATTVLWAPAPQPTCLTCRSPSRP
jgi:iron complex outermembrane receptor protein